jgi:hypothetical protein
MQANIKSKQPVGVSRRRFALSACALASFCFARHGRAGDPCTEAEVVSEDASQCLSKSPISKDEWFSALIGARPFNAPLSVSRFLDRTYYLNREMVWTPRTPIAKVEKIVVPKGFVTDFASIPRVFWAVLAPDDEYVMPAIVHDWLYWQQTLSRSESDTILRLAMEELKLDTWKIRAIYKAVSLFGGAAWEQNAKIKNDGQRRVLKFVPTDPAILWSDWKLRPGVFQ